MGFRDISYLLEDPQPELLGSHLWKALFRFCITTTSDNKLLGLLLLKRFWTMRKIGTMILRTRDGLKFVPIYDSLESWPSKEFYLEMRELYLVPHEKKIRELLDMLKEV